MKIEKLEDFKGGWFIGNFHPSLLKTENVEVGVKSYKAGDKEKAHVHKKATEITLVLSGIALFNGVPVSSGNIVVLNPGEWNAFEAFTDVTTVVIKTPSVKGDKYTE
jgi:quercetin dioxygenase-like cupin family protein